MSSADPSDEFLVERARRGDREALVSLYRRYVAEIYGYLLNQLGDVHDAEDVTSETFLRLVSKLDSFEGRASFRTWLYTVARNQLRDHWRRLERRPDLADLEPERLEVVDEPPPVPNPRATALGREVLRRLPDNYRRVIEMRILDGRSVRDTAQELNLSVSNVKVLQHRGLKAAGRIAAEISASACQDGQENEDDG